MGLWRIVSAWKGSIHIPEQSFEIREWTLQGDVCAMYLDFLRTALTWLPEERPVAEVLARHDFLMEGFNLICRRNIDNLVPWIVVSIQRVVAKFPSIWLSCAFNFDVNLSSSYSGPSFVSLLIVCSKMRFWDDLRNEVRNSWTVVRGVVHSGSLST